MMAGVSHLPRSSCCVRCCPCLLRYLASASAALCCAVVRSPMSPLPACVLPRCFGVMHEQKSRKVAALPGLQPLQVVRELRACV